MNIYFSQVREDPAIELSVCNMINDHNLNILMIGSGGCTLFSIINNNINNIDVVDINQSQINLILLKIEVISFLKNKYKFLDFIEGRFKKEEYDIIYNCIKNKLPTQCTDFWDDNMHLIYKGINSIGNYEKLFNELIDSKFNFKKVFNKENLITKFGINAISNSKDNFSSHFEYILNRYKTECTPENNYFYHQILYGIYSKKDLPYYFDNFDNISTYKNKINLIRADLSQKQLPDETYDIIHISNITDWMNNKIIDSFIQKIYKALKKNGFIIARKLLGNYNLKSKISEYFSVINVPEDKSFFYSEVVVGKKL